MTRNKKTKNSGSRAIRNEKEEAAGEDRISSLPDPLLLHILSFLKDTKETVKTCVLSKRWEFLWTDMMEINFREEDYDEEALHRSVERVGRIIAMCRSLNKFSIKLRYMNSLASIVNHWVYFAIKHKVKDISLQFVFNKVKYDLPQRLFQYSSLSNLYVNYCVMAPQGIIRWDSLESLSIVWVELSDSVMENILSNCPILKYLNLSNCTGLTYLNIKSPNLTTLDYWNQEYGHVPDISAPYLRVLSIYSREGGCQYKLRNVSSVVEATFEFDISVRYDRVSTTSTMNHMKQLLESLPPSIEKLKLGPQFLEIVSVPEVTSWVFPLYTKLWSLTLKIFYHEMSIPGILAILRSSPNLRTLRIEGQWITADQKKAMLDQYETLVKDYNMELVASHLKTVEIDKYVEVERMVTLVQVLLKCTNVLEKMVINLKAPSSSRASINYNKKISKRLRNFPKASPKAVFEFHYY